ncbi:HepT-like ribonuclease domain-containing protein [Saccharopolyspora sp. NPDC003752]
MRRATPQRLADIIEAIETIQRLTPADATEIERDERTRFSLQKLVEIVGEACNQVDEEVQRNHPEVPWRAIIGMRNRVVHSYWDVDEQILWDVVTVEIPRLLPQIRAILGSVESR